MQSLAVDISLAALLGDKVYSFGELLLHPIVSVLTLALGLPWLHLISKSAIIETIDSARLICRLVMTT